MMNRLKVLTLFTILSFLSCNKDNLEDSDFNVCQTNSFLKVRTSEKSSQVENYISFPVNVYIFNMESNICVGREVLESSDDSLNVSLIEGDYVVHSIGGLVSDNYTIPTKEEATPTSSIELVSGKPLTDLMSSTNYVSLVDGGTNNLTITMQRKVTLLEGITIKNVPSASTEVYVTLTPIHKNLLINGKYSDATTSQRISLVKEEGTKIWKSTEQMYMLQPSEALTIQITIKKNNDVASYSYSTQEQISANYKLKIDGEYTEKIGVAMTGTLQGVDWAGSKEVQFTFDESGGKPFGDDQEIGNGSNDDVVTPEEGDSDAGSSGSVPQVGTIYNDMFVFDSNTTNGVTTITCMCTNESSIRYSDKPSDEELKKSYISEHYAKQGISMSDGWRIPTLDELMKFLEKCDKYNEMIANNAQYKEFEKTGFYVCEKDGNIVRYNVVSNTFLDYLNDQKIRFVKTIQFK